MINLLKRFYTILLFIKAKILWRQDFIQSTALLLDAIRGDFRNPLEITHKYRGKGLFWTISASQNPKEFGQFYNFLKTRTLNTIVEIGTDKGGTLFIWASLIARAGLLVSMDLNSRRNYSTERRKFYNLFGLLNLCNINFVVGDSHLIDTKDKLEELLSGKKIDFLFIDGDHTYDGVKKDFYLYSDLVSDGGVIAFHDIRTKRKDCGVPQFWDEIKFTYGNEAYKEFCENNFSPLGGGIGLLIKNVN
jgi:predicted O-methyltransferase YrrM